MLDDEELVVLFDSLNVVAADEDIKVVELRNILYTRHSRAT